MNKEAIKAECLSVGYRDQLLIEQQNVVIPAGRITVLLGANGCGKSTLLKALAGLQPSKEGKIRIGQEEITAISRHRLARKLAFLPQHPSAPDSLTVAELVMMGRYPYRRLFFPPTLADCLAVTGALEQTDMKNLTERRLSTLSGGQRQRAWLAMVLAQQTEILMLDEPTSYLDLNHQYELLNLLRRLNREQGKTLILVLHDLNQAFEFADHLIYMRQGSLIAEGSPAQTATPELVSTVFGLHCDIRVHPQAGCPLLISLAGCY